LLSGLVMAASSLLIWVVIPKGFHPAWLLWIEIHKWSGFAFIVGAFLHVVLHFRWIVRMTVRLFRRRGA